MAETYLNAMAKGKMTAGSAGLEPGVINQYVAEALLEDGMDIYNKKTRTSLNCGKLGLYIMSLLPCVPLR